MPCGSYPRAAETVAWVSAGATFSRYQAPALHGLYVVDFDRITAA
jgi:hypothetical protein